MLGKCPHETPKNLYAAEMWDFGYFKKKWLHWESCRDVFQDDFNEEEISEKGLYFKCPELEKTALFLALIEEKLKLKIRSKFGTTDIENVLYIKPSPWWLEKPLKKSFLTMSLRASKKFKPSKSIYKAFEKSKYGKPTMIAVRRFFRGYTNSDIDDAGWVDVFRKLKLNKVREILKK